jgi:hypothetical protein
VCLHTQPGMRAPLRAAIRRASTLRLGGRRAGTLPAGLGPALPFHIKGLT